MSQLIQIRRGKKEELDTYGPLEIGELGLCTDTEQVYIGAGGKNVKVGYSNIWFGALCLWDTALNHYTWSDLLSLTWEEFQTSEPVLA